MKTHNVSHFYHHRGLTLIEVLVALVILLTTISISTVTYQTLLITSQRASAQYEVISQLEFVKKLIREELQSQFVLAVGQNFDGNFTFQAKNISWSAELAKKGKPPNMLSEALEDVTYPDRYYLYSVKMTIKLGASTREFNYKELLWDQLKNID